MQNPPIHDIEAVDLFCGVGGLSAGLRSRRIVVKAGIDIDPACRYPYEANHSGAKFVLRDVRSVTGADLRTYWSHGPRRLLAGCAPCQPFSSYSNTKVAADKERWSLLFEFGRLVRESEPDFVTMENVPGIVSERPFTSFMKTLKELRYNVVYGVLNAADYGAPQQRRRLVLIASRLGAVTLPPPTHDGPRRWTTVRQAIGDLPRVEAGANFLSDPLHIAAELSPTNMLRIQASKPGGTWRDWPERLISPCHRKESGKRSGGVYGRMEWDGPAPTMTTLCNGYGNGRFGHPEQHRGITLREAAIFQSFPRRYKFVEPKHPVKVKELARLIGNAVPPVLGKAVGRAILTSMGQAKN